MRQAKPQHGLDKLVCQRTRIDHRDIQIVAEMLVGLMHRCRAQQNNVRPVFGDGRIGLGKKKREDILFLSGKERLVVRRDVNGPDRRDMILDTEVADGLFIEMEPVLSHGDD